MVVEKASDRRAGVEPAKRRSPPACRRSPRDRADAAPDRSSSRRPRWATDRLPSRSRRASRRARGSVAGPNSCLREAARLSGAKLATLSPAGPSPSPTLVIDVHYHWFARLIIAGSAVASMSRRACAVSMARFRAVRQLGFRDGERISLARRSVTFGTTQLRPVASISLTFVAASHNVLEHEALVRTDRSVRIVRALIGAPIRRSGRS